MDVILLLSWCSKDDYDIMIIWSLDSTIVQFVPDPDS